MAPRQAAAERAEPLLYTLIDASWDAVARVTARAEGVGRFVYVSVYSTPALSRTAYVAAHKAFAERLALGARLRGGGV